MKIKGKTQDTNDDVFVCGMGLSWMEGCIHDKGLNIWGIVSAEKGDFKMTDYCLGLAMIIMCIVMYYFGYVTGKAKNEKIQFLKKQTELKDIEIKDHFDDTETLQKCIDKLKAEHEKDIKSVWKEGINQGKKIVMEKIKRLKNPYPKDVFMWNNKEKLNFNRGRFNKHCYEIFENIRSSLKEQLNPLSQQGKGHVSNRKQRGEKK